MKKVLITNFEIVQFSGSEIHSATIAKYFKQLGYEVYMGVIETGSPLYDVVKDNFDKVIYLLKDDFDFSTVEFDLVWVHHSFLLDWLIFEKGLQAKKIIIGSLSPVEPFESVPIYANELTFCLANSQETYAQLTEKEKIQNVSLFENYSFTSYFEKEIQVKELHNIAVVSNHIPPEEMEAIEILRQKGYTVDVYGLAGNKTFITDEVLGKYDCVITIGKTVQFAMSLKIPVYVYDIHGGDGYLTMDNIEQNRSHNFSGRSFGKKDGETITNEIIEKFETELSQLESIKQYALENFCFEKKMEEILQKIEKSPDIDIESIRKKYENYERNLLVTKRLAEHAERRQEQVLKEKTIEFYKIKDEELAEKQREIDNRGYLMEELEKKNKLLTDEIQAIKNSRSWRYTKFLRRARGNNL